MAKRRIISEGNSSKDPLLLSIKNKRKECLKIGKNNIEIESKKSSRLNIFGPCSFCGYQINPLWKFNKTAVGPIFLCQRCKERRYKERKTENMTRREGKELISNEFFKDNVILVGKIESNQSKH